MDYEKKYREVFEQLKEAVQSNEGVTMGKLENLFPDLVESKDEIVRKEIVHFLGIEKGQMTPEQYKACEEVWIPWLEKQKPIDVRFPHYDDIVDKVFGAGNLESWEYDEAESIVALAKEELLKDFQGERSMIQWKGDNLKEVIEFTGKSPRFGEWFENQEDYENYVRSHDNIFKIFNEDGSHVEVPVGAWIVKTPDGHNVASKYRFVPKSEWSDEDRKILSDTIESISYLLDLLDGTKKLGPNKEYRKAKCIRELNQLKSIKSRNQWKPTEEQMTILQYLVENSSHPNPKVIPVLESLYKQLKAL